MFSRGGLEIVTGGEDVTGIIRGEGVDAMSDLGANFVRCAEGEDFLVVNGSMETDAVAQMLVGMRSTGW